MDLLHLGVAEYNELMKILPPTLSREDIARLIGYRNYAGYPKGNETPRFIGEKLRDTTSGRIYMAFGATSNDWYALSSGDDNGILPISITTANDVSVWSGPCFYHGFRGVTFTAGGSMTTSNVRDGVSALGQVIDPRVAADYAAASDKFNSAGILCQFGVYQDFNAAASAQDTTYFVRPLTA